MEEKNTQQVQEDNVQVEVQQLGKDALIDSLTKENEELKLKLQKTEEAAKRLSSMYQLLQKDFEDYKIRTIREKEQIKEEAIERFAKAFLDVVDNFEKALESLKSSSDINSIIVGIQMVHYQVVSLLQEFGIQKIDASGEFNPLYHEALEIVKNKDLQVNQIVKVLQNGYMYKGKVIRPAKVVVAIQEEEEEIT
ncbi:MAG: nucleotide exchange factor GrpE [Hydrogenothermaceae bacterium]|nr:nucleotide exchange factor GrpE [Hydrogenothermaceae bacterium]